jgi:hypothetical protein
MTQKNNPFLAHLPRLLERTELVQSITQMPNLDRNGSLEDKLLECERIISEFMVGLPRHYYVVERVLLKMKASYIIRTPETLISKLNEIEGLESDEAFRILDSHIKTVPSIYVTYLIGLAGTGKTSIINFIVKMFPRIIPHKTLGIYQVPIIKIDTPHRSSRKDLCINILEELDNILGSDYVKKIRRENENEIIKFVKRKLILHFVGTIVIDEIQDLKSTTKGPSEITFAFLKRLTNQLGVPLFFVGSLAAREVLFSEFQLATRSQGFKWDRFDSQSDHWNKFITRLFSIRVIDNVQELTSELKAAYYILTQGIPRLLTTLHCEAQKLCLLENRDMIEIKDLLIVSKNLFSGIDLAIEGIKNYTTQILSRFSDLMTIEKFTSIQTNVDNDDRCKDNEERKAKKNKAESNDSTMDQPYQNEGDLIILHKNCSYAHEVHTVFIEHKVIPSISEIVQYHL